MGNSEINTDKTTEIKPTKNTVKNTVKDTTIELKYKQANYLDEIHNIEDKTIDAIITDPPYWHVQGGMSSKKLNVGKFKKGSFLQEKLVMFKKKGNI